MTHPPGPGGASLKSRPLRLARFRARLRHLYRGESPTAVRFRLGVIAVDLLLIAFFIATPLIRATPFFFALDYLAAFILLADLLARAFSWTSFKSWIRRPTVWIDLFVLATLLFPEWLFSLAFLRVLRIWTLFHSDFFWETVGRRYDDTRMEDSVRAASTFATFIFVVTGFVYTSFAGKGVGVDHYIGALYFTVATLTTTGFGDITLPRPWGRIISIVTMIAGITFFLNLAQVMFRPHKVRFTCPACSLMRHDADAAHCKACGVMLNIPNAGV